MDVKEAFMSYEEAKKYFYSNYEELKNEFSVNVDYLFSQIEIIINDLEEIKKERGQKNV